MYVFCVYINIHKTINNQDNTNPTCISKHRLVPDKII